MPYRLPVVDAAESTCVAARDYFDGPRDLEKDITLGLGALLASRSVFLMASGTFKEEVIRAVVEGPMDPAIPGTCLREHPDCHVYLGVAAAASLG